MKPAKQFSIDDAMADPERVFGCPEMVVSDPRLDRSAKTEILRRWEQDALALSTAQAEGMEGDSAPKLQRVQRAIRRLTKNGDC